MDIMVIQSLAAIIILCLIHIFVNKLKLSNIPRSKWLSFAGGISVTYIFLQSFPELGEFHELINSEGIIPSKRAEEFGIYLIALLGLTFFYGLEQQTKKSRESKRASGDEEPKKNISIFWIHISSFAVYNFIIGYLLISREETSMGAMALYVVAMSFHLIVTDHSIEDHFGRYYRKRGRWILVSALFLGWILSIFTEFPEVYVAIVFAFIAGGIIMNVLKEELPRERESNLPAFCAGVLIYSILLVFL